MNTSHLPRLFIFFLLFTTGINSWAGTYLALSGGKSKPDKEHYDGDSAMRLSLGYRFSPVISIESSYFNLGQISIDGSHLTETLGNQLESILTRHLDTATVNVASANGNIRMQGIDLCVLAEARFNPHFGVFGRLGVWGWQAKQRHQLALSVNSQALQFTEGSDEYDGADLVVGLGAHIRFSERWGALAEVSNYGTEDLNNRYVGAGLKYYF